MLVIAPLALEVHSLASLAPLLSLPILATAPLRLSFISCSALHYLHWSSRISLCILCCICSCLRLAGSLTTCQMDVAAALIRVLSYHQPTYITVHDSVHRIVYSSSSRVACPRRAWRNDWMVLWVSPAKKWTTWFRKCSMQAPHQIQVHPTTVVCPLSCEAFTWSTIRCGFHSR